MAPLSIYNIIMTKRAQKSQRIPITAITGFLGAGKTTLLNYMLTHNDGIKFGVVVNDFGDINIDEKLIVQKSDQKLELSGGCICCSLKTLDLQEAIEQFTYPTSGIDYILIEASGLAQPKDLALTLRNTIGQRVRFDSIVTVLDALNLEKNASSSDLATEQIEYTDFVLINKTDLVKRSKIKQIRQLIKSINPKARVLESVRGAIDLRLILDQDTFLNHISNKLDSKHDHRHAHEDFASFSFTSHQSLHPKRFEKFVNTQLPTSVYRAKGIVDLGSKGHHRKYILQIVGTRAEISYDNWHNQIPTTELVFIGQNMPHQQILQNLRACIDESPESDMGDISVRLPQKNRD